jgi:hypothetical protein
MAIYPNSNLPSASQPWGREIQKNVENVTAQFLSERTNNTARDAQLEASYKRLSATSIETAAAVVTAQAAATAAGTAAATANSAISGLTSLGSAGSAYSVYANNITGGTITGVTFRTAASGTRIELSGTTMSTYYGVSLVGYVYGDSEYGGSYKFVDSGGSNGVTVFNSQTILRGPVGNVFINGSNLQINSSSSVDLVASSGFNVTGGMSVNSGDLVVNGAGTITGALKSAYTYANTVTSAANIYMASDGIFKRSTASSARFKENIQDIKLVANLDPHKLLSLPVRAFSYKPEHQPDASDSRYNVLMPGFIAEEVEEAYPLAADFDDGVPYSWNERMVVPGLLALVQELYQRIEILEGK